MKTNENFLVLCSDMTADRRYSSGTFFSGQGLYIPSTFAREHFKGPIKFMPYLLIAEMPYCHLRKLGDNVCIVTTIHLESDRPCD